MLLGNSFLATSQEFLKNYLEEYFSLRMHYFQLTFTYIFELSSPLK